MNALKEVTEGMRVLVRLSSEEEHNGTVVAFEDNGDCAVVITDNPMVGSRES